MDKKIYVKLHYSGKDFTLIRKSRGENKFVIEPFSTHLIEYKLANEYAKSNKCFQIVNDEYPTNEDSAKTKKKSKPENS